MRPRKGAQHLRCKVLRGADDSDCHVPAIKTAQRGERIGALCKRSFNAQRRVCNLTPRVGRFKAVSRSRICTVTAGGVMWSTSAAAAKLPARKAVLKVRSWRKVTWRIGIH